MTEVATLSVEAAGKEYAARLSCGHRDGCRLFGMYVSLLLRFSFGLGWNDGKCRVNGSCGAYSDAFAAGLARIRVDVGKVVGDGYGSEGTLARALSASDTCGLTDTARHGSAFAVGACHPHSAVTASDGSQFEQMTRTFGCTCAAGRAFVGIHDRKHGLGIDADGSETADGHTVAASQTSVGAAACADCDGIHHGARAGSVVSVQFRPGRACAVALQHGDAALDTGHGLDSEDFSDFSNSGRRGYGAVDSVERALPDTLRGEVAAALEPATAAVRSRQERRYGVDAWIFIDMESPCRGIKHQGTCKPQSGKKQNRI